MANDYSSQPLTGKSKRKQVQPVSEALMLPVVFEDTVEKKGDVINDATKSGKQKGAMLCLDTHDTLVIAIAVGSKEDSNWLTANKAVTTITPA